MEDSLKRLQRVRQTNKSSANLSVNSMSDDDKIRLQLSLDINELGKQLEEKFDGYKGDANFNLLMKIVEDINAFLNKQQQQQQSQHSSSNSIDKNAFFIEENETTNS